MFKFRGVLSTLGPEGVEVMLSTWSGGVVKIKTKRLEYSPGQKGKVVLFFRQ